MLLVQYTTVCLIGRLASIRQVDWKHEGILKSYLECLCSTYKYSTFFTLGFVARSNSKYYSPFTEGELCRACTKNECSVKAMS